MKKKNDLKFLVYRGLYGEGWYISVDHARSEMYFGPYSSRQKARIIKEKLRIAMNCAIIAEDKLFPDASNTDFGVISFYEKE